MAIGDRIRIVTEEEYHIMSPPRMPRGEKPRTTIRYLRRQISNLQQELISWKIAGAERDKQIARQDVELSEAAELERMLVDRVERSAEQHGALLAAQQKNATRLAYLEGYYDKSRESLPRIPAETHGRSGAGNQGDLPDGAQD